MTEETDQDTILVCVPVTDPLALPDNVVAQCAACRSMLQFRPDAPSNVRRLCISCAVREIPNYPTATFAATPQTLLELFKYVRRGRMH
jgi:hypothetical protein